MTGLWDWALWLSLAALWTSTFLNMRDLHRRKKRQVTEDMNKYELAKYTGLTDLQVQVAMDAAMALFHQRIHEMQRSSRG